MNEIIMEISPKKFESKLKFKTPVRDDIIKDFFLTMICKNKFPQNDTKMLLLLLNDYAVLHNNIIKLQGPFANLLKLKDGIIKIGKKKFKYKAYRNVFIDSVSGKESMNKIKREIMDKIGGENCRFSIGADYCISSSAYLFEREKSIAEIYHYYNNNKVSIQIYIDRKVIENSKKKGLLFKDFANDVFSKFMSNVLNK